MKCVAPSPAPVDRLARAGGFRIDRGSAMDSSCSLRMDVSGTGARVNAAILRCRVAQPEARQAQAQAREGAAGRVWHRLDVCVVARGETAAGCDAAFRRGLAALLRASVHCGGYGVLRGQRRLAADCEEAGQGFVRGSGMGLVADRQHTATRRCLQAVAPGALDTGAGSGSQLASSTASRDSVRAVDAVLHCNGLDLS